MVATAVMLPLARGDFPTAPRVSPDVLVVVATAVRQIWQAITFPRRLVNTLSGDVGNVGTGMNNLRILSTHC